MAALRPFQVMDPLLPELDAALGDDIAEHGVEEPPTVDPGVNQPIDGDHRIKHCQRLGTGCFVKLQRFKDDRERTEYVLRTHLLRRHLGPIGWAKAFDRFLDVEGVRLGRGARNDLAQTSATFAEVAARAGAKPRTARYRLNLARKLAPYRELAAKVDAGAMSGAVALKQVGHMEAKARWDALPVPSLPSDIRIECCDFRDLKVEPRSAPLVLTDPPYPKKWLRNWADVEDRTYRALEPRGCLITYAPKEFLPTVMKHLGRRLKWALPFDDVHEAADAPIHALNTRSGWDIILMYCKPPVRPAYRQFDDVLHSGRDREFHPYQKDLGVALKIVEAYTQPGDLVVDWFAGSGTFAVAAARLRRRFRGCDINPEHVKTAVKRVDEELRAQARRAGDAGEPSPADSN